MKILLNQNNVVLNAAPSLFYICKNTNNDSIYATENPENSVGVIIGEQMYDYSKNYINPPYYSVYSIIDVDSVPSDFKTCTYKWNGEFVVNTDVIPLTNEELANKIPTNINDLELAVEELYEMIGG